MNYLFILLFSITLLFLTPSAESSENLDSSFNSLNSFENLSMKSKKTGNKNKFMFFAFGTMNFGEVSYYPFTPVEGDYTQYTNAFGPNPSKPYNLSYGFGVGIDFNIIPFISLFIDGGMNSWKLLLANKNGYAYGQWVAEATNYDSAVVGPFTMDTYYYMDATNIRLGARYIVSQKRFQPWVGGGILLSAWQATIGNRKEGLKIGSQDSGLAFGFSFTGGMDVMFSDFVLRLFVDYGSAIAKPRITGLLQDPYSSAVFENSGGEFTTGPYRAGLAVGVKY